MKISLQWLLNQKFFDCSENSVKAKMPGGSASWKHLLLEDLLNRMPLRGFEVEGIERVGDDDVIDFAITPNRGDCLSMRGLAREIACLYELPFEDKDSAFSTAKKFPSLVKIQAPKECPVYAGRFIKKIATDKRLPAHITDRLNKSGIESIHPVVDICNYVMLELGQPMHAFDADKIKNFNVRYAKEGEKIEVLGGQTLALAKNTLVIADEEGPQAVAGVIGGLHSSVTENTTNIFLESAHFIPEAIAGRARQYGLHTDGAQRFERGVDPALPLVALEEATKLIQENLGGEAEEITLTLGEAIPPLDKISLRPEQLKRILGCDVPVDVVQKILTALGMKVSKDLSVMPPSFRFDIRKEYDLIEEVARIYGFDRIPVNIPRIEQLAPAQQERLPKLRAILVNQGFREIISYSFIGEDVQKQCFPHGKTVALKNPLSSELAIMRTSLWPSLLQTAQYNFNRQQTRARYFELGRVYFDEYDDAQKCLKQPMMLAGLMAGSVLPEQWGTKTNEVDFFDLKGEVELLLTSLRLDATFEQSEHPLLHPGQAAKILSQGKVIGHFGRLHPSFQSYFGLVTPIYLFELALEEISLPRVVRCQSLSKFPSVRRDFAFLMNRDQEVADVLNLVREKCGGLCQDVILFDVYQGKNMPQDQKSIAFGVVLQDAQATLSDEKVAALSEDLIQTLQLKFQMQLRVA